MPVWFRRLLVGVLLVVPLPAQSVWFVRVDGADSNAGTGPGAGQAFATIGRALTAANDGDEIRIAPGTYVEQLAFGAHDLVVRGGVPMGGIPPGESVVRMPSAGRVDPISAGRRVAGRGPLALVSNTLTADALLWIADPTPASPSVIEVRDLVLDGAHLAASRVGDVYAGAVVRGCRALWTDCRFEGFDATPAGPAPAHALWIDGGVAGAGSTRVTIDRCRFEGLSGTQVVCRAGDLHARGCEFQHSGAITFATHGVEFATEGGGSLTGCRFDDFANSGPGDPSAAVRLIDQASPVVIDTCTMRGVDIGVDVLAPPLGVVEQAIGAFEIVGNTTSAVRREGVRTAVGGGVVAGNLFLDAGRAGRDDTTPTALNPDAVDWSGNTFVDLAVSGPRPIPGTAGAVDADGRAGQLAVRLATPAASPLGEPRSPRLRDLDGDGLADLACVDAENATVEVRYGRGDGGFDPGETVALPAGLVPLALGAGRLDADALVDLAIVCEDGTVVVLRNTGAGPTRFASGLTTATLTGGSLGSFERPVAVAVADLDGSPGDDLLVALAGSPPFVGGGGRVLIGDGTGTAFTVSAPLPGVVSAQDVVLTDLDGDGDRDAVIADAGAGLGGADVVRVFANAAGTLVAGPVLTEPSPPRGVATVDLDGDGSVELVVACEGQPFSRLPGEVVVHRGLGALSFAAGVSTAAGYGTAAVAVTDLFEDGVPDVVAADRIAGTLTLLSDWDAAGSGGFGWQRTLAGASIPSALAAANLDVDAPGELVVADPGAGAVLTVDALPRDAVQSVGDGCFGCNGVPSAVVIGGRPTPGDTAFGIGVRGACPVRPAFLAISLLPPAPAIEGCTVSVLSIDASFLVLTTSTGGANVPIPIPTIPSLIGAFVTWQWAIFDPQGPFLGLAFSNTLVTRIGL